MAHDRDGDNHGDGTQARQHQSQAGDDRADEALGGFGVLLLELDVARDHGSGQRALAEQIAQQIGQRIGNREAVENERATEVPSPQPVADQAEDSADQRPTADRHHALHQTHGRRPSAGFYGCARAGSGGDAYQTLRCEVESAWFPSMADASGPDTSGSQSTSPGDLTGLTRRGLVLSGVALALAGCVRGGGRPVAGQGEGIWYTIQVNDSLASLNRRSGVPIERIIELNGLSEVGLRPGARIWLPGIRSLGPDPLADDKGVPGKIDPKLAQKPPEKLEHYELVPRSAWTDLPVGANHIEMGKISRITVHHTDEHPGMADLPDIEVVRRIERYHRDFKHWAAIGYHYLVGKDGKIYEGRPVKYQGAHVSSNNENNLGISVIGDFDKHLPNSKQLVALRAFLDDERARYNVLKQLVYGHRELKATLCPGDMLMAWVQDYRRN